MRYIKHGTTSDLLTFLLSFIVPLFLRAKRLTYSLTSFAEAVEYHLWSFEKFGKIRYFRTKKKLLQFLIEYGNEAEKIEIYEFGVAFGETAHLLNSNLNKRAKYFGYDTFEGLPTSWRRLPAGALTTNGRVPQIANENFVFYKGLVQETFPATFIASNIPKILIFDLDLYEPTLFVWKLVLNSLNSGDILYFDEAFDKDERVILENYVLNSIRYSVLGFSVLGLVLKVE